MLQPPQVMYATPSDVINAYSEMVYRLAFARTGKRYDADEVYQEVFLRYFKRQPVFETEQHRKAWLIRVTINCAKSLWSAPWRRRMVPLEEDFALESPEDMDLWSELQQLPPKFREVLHLFYYEGLSVEEIGCMLNRKKSTVRTHLTRARAMLKTRMEEDYDV